MIRKWVVALAIALGILSFTTWTACFGSSNGRTKVYIFGACC